MVLVKRIMLPKGGIIRETPTGRAVGQYLLWHNFSCCHLDCYTIGASLFVLPYHHDFTAMHAEDATHSMIVFRMAM